MACQSLLSSTTEWVRARTGADGATALADGESQAGLHGHRVDELKVGGDIVARHHHLHALRQLHLACAAGMRACEQRDLIPSPYLAVTLSLSITISTPSGSFTLPARQARTHVGSRTTLVLTHCRTKHAHKLLTLLRSAQAHVWSAVDEGLLAEAAMTKMG